MPQTRRRVEPIPSQLPSSLPPTDMGLPQIPLQDRSVTPTPPDPRIERIRQLMAQAQTMEQQAAPQQVQPQGVKQNVVAGLSAIGQPGGYGGMMAQRQATERQRQQDLYERANALRQRGVQEEAGMETARLHGIEEQRYNRQETRQEQQDREKAAEAATKPELVGPGVAAIRPGQTTPFFTNTPKATPEKSLQPKEVQFKNGKHGTANFNPTTGKYHDPISEADITANVTGAYERPSPDQNVVIRTVNDKGEPIERIVPKTPGSEFKGAPTALETNRRDQANIISNYADHILSLIDKSPNAVGPLLGRVARGEIAIGNVPPDVKALHTALGSFEALQPILHGFRGGSQTVDHFHEVIGGQNLNAEALKASLREIKALAGMVSERGSDSTGTGKDPLGLFK